MSLRPDQAMQAIELLKKIALFNGATDDHRIAIAAALDARAYAAGKVVILEQEISKTLYLLAKGAVGIWRRKNNQKDRIALLKAPDFFGEVSMFSDSPATALVKTEEDSMLFYLTRERFDALIASDVALNDLVKRNIETIKASRPPVRKPADEQPA